jgi:uncharacterized protein YndB with AHSA1/START domain
MSVKKDASGRRFVQAEVEVPGTPEEVWQAIATENVAKHWPMKHLKELRHPRFKLTGAPQIGGRAPFGDSLYQRQGF